MLRLSTEKKHPRSLRDEYKMISDAVVIGIVLGLVFAATCYYLYTRNSSLERKVGLMENILLDLKVTTEQVLMSATEAPSGPTQPTLSAIAAHGSVQEHEEHTSSHESEEGVRTLSVDTPRSGRITTNTTVSVERQSPSISPNYEAMTYKELISIAKQKGVSGTRNASKAHVIDLLRRHDAGGSAAKQADVADSLDAHFITTPLDENMGNAGTDLELLSANELTQVNEGGAPLSTEEVDGSLVQ
jgi:hypothetical protein